MWRGTDGQTDRRTAIATENSKINICNRFDKDKGVKGGDVVGGGGRRIHYCLTPMS